MKSISENLIQIDVPRTTAKVVEFLKDGESRTLREIERGCDLRQGEVSLAVKSLTGYITFAEGNASTRGRPTKIITMSKKNYERYIDGVTKDAQENCDAIIKSIVELKGCL